MRETQTALPLKQTALSVDRVAEAANRAGSYRAQALKAGIE